MTLYLKAARNVLVVAMAVMPAGGRLAAADAGVFAQDRFAIGLWVLPQTQERLADRYQEIADANFTLVIGTAGTNAAAQLALCEKAGLQALVDSTGPVEKLPDGAACWG